MILRSLRNLDPGAERKTQKGVANGYAGLDANGTIPVAQVPATLLTDIGVAENTPLYFGDPQNGNYVISENGVLKIYANNILLIGG